ncbi:MAG TPA: thioesterase family protein [Ktedonobacteraceae bacterium]|nr:thioesterase family protein [Ktedonobacteraceae bacterium]
MPQSRLQVRVPFADVDSSGRIHFTAMMRYMENAEHELVRSLGFPRASTFLDIAFPRVHVSCNYRGAVRYDDLLSVEARVEHVGRSSWTVAFTIRLLQGAEPAIQLGKTVAEGQMTIVAMDTHTERACALPDALREALSGSGN